MLRQPLDSHESMILNIYTLCRRTLPACPAGRESNPSQHPLPNPIRIRIPRPPININNARLSAVSFGCFVYLLFNKTGARPSALTARK